MLGGLGEPLTYLPNKTEIQYKVSTVHSQQNEKVALKVFRGRQPLLRCSCAPRLLRKKYPFGPRNADRIAIENVLVV